jgi:ribosomal protein L44E
MPFEDLEDLSDEEAEERDKVLDRAIQRMQAELGKDGEIVADYLEMTTLTLQMIHETLDQFTDEEREILVNEASSRAAGNAAEDIFRREVYDTVKPNMRGKAPVTVKTAYSWLCDKCGKDQFEKPIKVEFGPGEKEEAFRKIHDLEDYQELPDGWATFELCCIPGRVKCKDCNTEYSTEDEREYPEWE